MDLNGDGRTDILSGSYSPGEIRLFPRLEDGGFGAGEILNGMDGKPVLVGRASAVFASDWDRDGDLDLVVGNIDGEVHLVPNESGGAALRFGAAVRILSGIPGGNAGPTVADWDGDGTPDLIVGCGDGSVRFYRGSGAEGPPALADPVVLVAAGDWSGGRGVRAKPWVTDWNADGRLDLLVGDFTTVQGETPDIPEAERERLERARKAQSEISQKMGEIYREVHAELKQEFGDDEAAIRGEMGKRLNARDDYKALLERIQAAQKITMKYRTPSTPHGFVWLHLRQAAVTPAEDE